MRFRLFVASLLCMAFVVPALAMAEEGEAKKDPPKRPSVKEFFQKLDKNADGAVTLDELPEQAKERGARMFKMKDADEDGKVTFEEFSKRMHRRGGPGRNFAGRGPGFAGQGPDGPVGECPVGPGPCMTPGRRSRRCSW